MRQKDVEVKEEIVYQCFHLVKYVIDHGHVRFFFLISLRTYSQLLNDVNICTPLLIPSVPLATSFQPRLLCSSHKFIIIQIFYLNI